MKNRKGFTLVELMVVVAIIGVLGAMLFPQVTGFVEKAKASKIVAVVDSLKTACTAYYSDTGVYGYEYASPWYTGATNHRFSMNPTVTGWAGPYLQSVLSRADNPYSNYVLVYNTTANWYNANGTAGFDLDNDGTQDTTGNGNMVVFYSIPQTVAERVNDLIDGDTSTNANWMTSGQLEYRNTSYLCAYIIGGR